MEKPVDRSAIRDLEAKIRTVESHYRRDYKKDQVQQKQHALTNSAPTGSNTRGVGEKEMTLFDDGKNAEGSAGIVVKINGKSYKISGVKLEE